LKEFTTEIKYIFPDNLIDTISEKQEPNYLKNDLYHYALILSSFNIIAFTVNLAFLTLKTILPDRPNEINIIISTNKYYLKNKIPSTIYTFGVFQSKNFLSLNIVFFL
jgi:hypothetical protein